MFEAAGPIAAIGSCTAIGAALDMLLHRRAKSYLHDHVTSWWVALSDTQVRNLASALAAWTIGRSRSLFGGRLLSWRALLIGAAVSVVLTLTALAVGSQLVEEVRTWLQTISVPKGLGELEQTRRADLVAFLGKPSLSFVNYASEHLGWLTNLLWVNLVLDGATVAVTLLVLDALSRYPGGFGLILLATNIVVAGLCAFGCLAASVVLSIFPMIDVVATSGDKHVVMQHWFHALIVSLPYAVTTLIPVTLFLLVLAFLIVAKPLVAASRFLSLTLLERVADDPPEKLLAFTTLGTLVGLLIATTLLIFN